MSGAREDLYDDRHEGGGGGGYGVLEEAERVWREDSRGAVSADDLTFPSGPPPLSSPTPYFILSSVWMAVRLRRVVPALSPWLVDLRCAALYLASGIEPPLLASRT